MSRWTYIHAIAYLVSILIQRGCLERFDGLGSRICFSKQDHDETPTVRKAQGLLKICDSGGRVQYALHAAMYRLR